MAASKKPATHARATTNKAEAKPAKTAGSANTAKKQAATPAKRRTTSTTSKRSTTKSAAKRPQAAPVRHNTPEAAQSAKKGGEAPREAHAPPERRVGRTPTGQVVPVTKQKTFRLPEDVVTILRTAVVEAAIAGDRLTESQAVTAAVRAWGKKHGYDKPIEDLP